MNRNVYILCYVPNNMKNPICDKIVFTNVSQSFTTTDQNWRYCNGK